jgi:hypothetical protein
MAPPETVEFAMYVYVRRSVCAMRTALLSCGGLSPVPRWSSKTSFVPSFKNVFPRSESSRMNRFHHMLVAPQLCRRTQRSDDVAPVRCSRVGAGLGSRITRSTLCQGGRCVLPWFASRGASRGHGGLLCNTVSPFCLSPSSNTSCGRGSKARACVRGRRELDVAHAKVSGFWCDVERSILSVQAVGAAAQVGPAPDGV